MPRNRAGFTLLELIVTVAIAGLLASGATLAFGRMLKAGRLSQGTDLVMGALREAQVRAFQDGNLWRVIVGYGDSILFLETASDPVRGDRGCSGTGWNPQPVRRYELPQGLTLGLRSGECVVFGQAGRVVSRAPYVVPPPGPYDPYQTAALSRLVDGKQLTNTDLVTSDPTAPETGTATWITSEMPDLVVDLREDRYVSALCIGLISASDKSVGYPGHLNVVASTTPTPPANDSGWTIPLLDANGPADPSDNSRERRCVNVAVDRQIRFLRVRLSGTRPGTDYWAFDEIDLGARFFTIQYGSDKKIVEVNPTTGRVTSKNG